MNKYAEPEKNDETEVAKGTLIDKPRETKTRAGPDEAPSLALKGGAEEAAREDGRGASVLATA